MRWRCSALRCAPRRSLSFEDASGSVTANTISKVAGSAKTLSVSAKSNVFINFAVSSGQGDPVFNIDPATVTAARLIIFTPKASTTGTLSIKALTSSFTETILTKTIPAPTIGATLDTIPLATIPVKGDFFISDITTQVKAWLTTPASEFGIAITSDGVATATLASKEGAGSGHPAIIEIDVNRGGGTVAGTAATFDSIGVGTTTPASPITVVSGTDARVFVQATGTSFAGYRQANTLHEYFTGINTGTDRWVIFDNTIGAERFSLLANGNIGIGTSSPSQSLDVARSALFGSADNAAFAVDGTGFARMGFIKKSGSNPVIASASGAPIIFSQTNQTNVFNNIGTSVLTERMRIAADGNIGIGTTAPEDALHVALTSTSNSTGTRMLVSAADTGFAGYRQRNTNREYFTGILTNDSAWSIFDNTAQATRLSLDANGNLFLNQGTAFKPGGGSWAVLSDRRLKKDIEPLNGALNHLMKLRSVTYEYIDPAKSHQFAGTQTGFIAQEVETVFPEWVTENADGYKTVAIRGFESLTVQALRELRQENEAEIAALKAANTALAAKLATLEARDRDREARLARIESALDDRPARTVRASLDLK